MMDGRLASHVPRQSRVPASLASLARMLGSHPTRRFGIRFWDGSELDWGEPRDFTLIVRDASIPRTLLASRDPSLLAEAYVNGRVDVEGDLGAAVGLARCLRATTASLPERVLRAVARRMKMRRATRDEDARDVRYHYDLPEEFFRLFLDSRLVYSCAYFAGRSGSLEEAQVRKLELICRKLKLRKGDRFLDVGCGWGALPIWAALHHGVRAVGITLSPAQALTARRRVDELGLADRVDIHEAHFAEVTSSGFDKIASVGMYEHVGPARHAEYFAAMRRALRPGGLFLNHGITRSQVDADDLTGGDFIFRNVFPGASLSTISHAQQLMERAGFEILDVQGLRAHYALTLREWARRFAAHRELAAMLVPERVLRAWDIYLTGCADAFDDGLLGVYQVLACAADEAGRQSSPFTREEIDLPPGDVVQ